MRAWKSLLYVSTGAFLTLALPAFGEGPEPAASPGGTQTAPAEEDLTLDVALTRAAIQVRRQALVTAAMDLSPEEAQVFWPLYREYREEMMKANEPFVALLTSYLENGGQLSNDVAAKALDG